MKYCNGAETFYDYDPSRRWLNNLQVNVGSNSTILENSYGYDAVGNVLEINSEVNGSTMNHQYEYDRFYRLTDAYGTHSGNTEMNYFMYFAYDHLNNITYKGTGAYKQGPLMSVMCK